MKNRKILVSEIFGPTIAGEGATAGRVTVFVRTGGCDFRCVWCDTPHAVLPCHKQTWEPLDTAELWRRVNLQAGGVPVLITISGGNPALQPLGDFIDQAHVCGCTVALETQGTVLKPWFAKLDHLILSPKPPSSGMRFRKEQFENCLAAAQGRPKISLKVIVMSEEDYLFARDLQQRYYALPFYVTPGNHTPPPGSGYNAAGHEFDTEGVLARTRWIIERAAADRWHDLSIIPQLHQFLWPNQPGR